MKREFEIKKENNYIQKYKTKRIDSNTNVEFIFHSLRDQITKKITL